MGKARSATALAGAALGAALGNLLFEDAVAQTVESAGAGAAAPASAGRQSFDAAFFRDFNPVNVSDVLAHVPGFEVANGEDRRGFGGTAGNVLINGERPSSKTPIIDQLKRIPASAVLRVELIAGSSSDSEVHGQGMLANVILRKATAKDSPTTFVAAVRHIQYNDRVGWTLQASRAVPLGDKAELAWDLQFPNLRGRTVAVEAVRDPSGNLTAQRNQFNQPNNIGVQGTANLKWRPDAADTVHVNLQYAPTWNTLGIDSIEIGPTKALRSALFGRTEYTNNYTGEAGADWERRFSPTLSAKAIGVATISSVDQDDVFNILGSNSALSLTRTQSRTTESGERVGRLAVNWRPQATHALEFGGEGAFNYRDTSLSIFNQTPGGPKVKAALAVASARVEETRAEAFVTDVWRASDRLTVETGFTYETSRIVQTGDEFKERTFGYPKPRVVGTWALEPGSNLRFSLERDVSQLDFAEFASSVNVVDATSIIGNPALEPEKAWKAKLQWDRRFGKRGGLTLTVFHDEIEDVHDFVVRKGADGNPADAYGNIGDGKRTGAELKFATSLDFLGVRNAELRFDGLWQDITATDPLTHEKRDPSVSLERVGSAAGAAVLNAGNKDWAYVVNFRQDVPSMKIAWGGALVQWAGRREYKRTEVVDYDRRDPRLELFVETTRIKPLTIRLFSNNIVSPPEERVRTFYQGDRSSGIVLRTETRKQKGGSEGTRSIAIQIAGKF